MSAIVARGMTLVRDGNTVIDSSDFEIPEASTVAIIGPNGSGKSSILHAITGLLDVDAGELVVLGRPPKEAVKDVAYVLQHLPITPGMPLTVREFVQMGRYSTLGVLGRPGETDRKSVHEAMVRLSIDDLADRHMAKLSGGQRQRAQVAQALAQDHSILLLDEPLTGLDVPSARVIDEIIHLEPQQGCTVVYTTHDLDEARSADYVILTSGRVVAFGTPDQVLTHKNLTEAYGLGALHPETHRHTPLLDAGHEYHESEQEPGVRSFPGNG